MNAKPPFDSYHDRLIVLVRAKRDYRVKWRALAGTRRVRHVRAFVKEIDATTFAKELAEFTGRVIMTRQIRRSPTSWRVNLGKGA